MKAKRSRRRRGPVTPKTWTEALERCPFRTVIGAGQGHRDVAELLPHLAHTIMVLGGDPTPINSATMGNIVAALQSGGTVMIMSDRADLRDYAKREIVAMALPAAGQA